MSGRFPHVTVVAKWIWLSLALTAYSLVSLPQLDLPGLYNDEAHVALRATAAVRAVKTYQWRNLPVSIQGYHGATSVYFLAPFLAVLPQRGWAVRIPFVIVGALTILLTYWLCLALLKNQTFAGVAALLLSLQPAFTVGNRIGAHFGSLGIFFAVSSLLCLLLWIQGKGRMLFSMSFLLLGLGCGTNGHFLFPFVSHLSILVMARRHIVDRMKCEGRKPVVYMATALLVFLLGALPILVSIGVNPGGFFSSISEGSGNSSLLFRDPRGNLMRYAEVINGTIHSEWQLGSPGLLRARLVESNLLFEPNMLSLSAFGGAILFLVLSLLLTKNVLHRNISGGLLVWGAVYFITSFFTLSIWDPVHISTFLPFPAIIIAYTLVRLSERFQRTPTFRISILAATCFLIVLPDIQNHILYHSMLNRVGGRRQLSPAVYDLAQWADSHHIGQIFVPLWSYDHAVPFLTDGRVITFPLNIPQNWGRLLDVPGNWVAIYQQGESGYSSARNESLKTLDSALNRAGRKLSEKARFYQRDGLVSAVVYQSE